MTPAEKEKIITENRPFIRQHVKQKFPKFMKIYDELCSAAEAAVWLELEKYLPEKGTITTFMSSYPSWRQHLYCKKYIQRQYLLL